MGLPAAPSVNAFHAIVTPPYIIAMIVTVFRLYYRIKRKLAWWDDVLIAFSALWATLLVIFVWLSTTPTLTQTVKVASYYICTFTFTMANYFARLSILMGILRIAPNPQTRMALKAMAVLFVTIMSVLMAQKLWVCEGSSQARQWKSEPDPSCHLGMQVALTELITDIICDACLVITPLTFLSRSKLKASQKRRLYAIFGASVATTITSIVQDWLILAAGGLREETASLIEVTVAILVANLPVVVSWIWRLRRAKQDEETSRFTTNYSHARRARPERSGVWAANTSELISESERNTATATAGSRSGLGSEIHQMGDVKRGIPVGAGGKRSSRQLTGDVLDLRAARKGAKEDPRFDEDFEDEDEDEKMNIAAFGLGPTMPPSELASFDSSHSRKARSPGPGQTQSHTRTRSHGADVDLGGFTVSAISYSDGRGGRRDAEFDIDIVDDINEAAAPAPGYHHSYPPPSATGTGAMLASPVTPATPSPAYVAYPASVAFASPPPPVPSQPQTQYQNNSSGFLSSLRRSNSQAAQNPASYLPSPIITSLPPNTTTTNIATAPPIARSRSSNSDSSSGSKTRTRSPGRALEPVPNLPPGVNSPSTPGSAASSNRLSHMGLFGRRSGVLVQQQVTISSDPDPEPAWGSGMGTGMGTGTVMGLGRVEEEERGRGRRNPNHTSSR